MFQLIPMLVLALMSDECKLQLSTMSTLKTVMDESPALLAQHVNLIVPRLLKLSKTDTSMVSFINNIIFSIYKINISTLISHFI